MTARHESFLSFYLEVIVLLCTASITAAQRDTNYEDPHSNCSPFCPCRCNRRSRVFNCIDVVQTVSNLDEIKAGDCGSLVDFAHFSFPYNSFQSFVDFVVRGTNDSQYGRMGPCSLNLSHNKLTRVANIEFNDCNYIYADFSHNNLSSLPSNIAVGLDPGEYIDLILILKFTHNRITTIRNFIHIEIYTYSADHNIYLTIDLSFNLIFISSFPDNFFLMAPDPITFVRSVDILMQNNRISFLESYPDVSDIVYTNTFRLRQNPLLTSRVGNGLDIYILLDLGHNRLSRLPSVGRRIYGPYLSLRLEGNPWNCDCQQRWIADKSSKLRRILNHQKSLQPYCHQPENLKGRPLLSLSRGEFICPAEDTTMATVYTPSVGGPIEKMFSRGESLPTREQDGSTLLPTEGTVGLTCTLVGRDSPVETIQWKVWTKGSSLKSLWSVKAGDNFSLVVDNTDHLSEGIYQCIADNGIEVFAESCISLDQEFVIGNHLTWLNMTLLLLFLSVSVGFIGVSSKLYRFNQREDSMSKVHNSYVGSNTIGSDNIPSAPVMFSTLKGVNLSHEPEHEDLTKDEPKGDVDCLYDDVSCKCEEEPTNDEGSRGDIDCIYDDVSCQSEDGKDQRRDIQRYKDVKFPNLQIMSHNKTGLNSSHYITKETIDRKGAAKSSIPDDSYYDVTESEKYTYITPDAH